MPEAGRVREVVGVFSDRNGFTGAVAALRAAGVPDTDLSVLASHETIDAAAPGAAAPSIGETVEDFVRALTGELKFAGPLGAAGVAVLFGGPVGVVIGGVIAAGVGGLALKEALGEALAHPHHDAFDRAVAAGGIILWVRVDSEEGETRAIQALDTAGGSNVHTNERTS